MSTELFQSRITDYKSSESASVNQEMELTILTLESRRAEVDRQLEAFDASFQSQTLVNLRNPITTRFGYERAYNFDVPDLKSIDRKTSRNFAKVIQSWLGYVVELSESTFVARLVDKMDSSTYEEATFSFDDISPGDTPLLVPGAVFYWSIGYATENGVRKKQSIIKFKRSVGLNVEEFDQIMDRATDLSDKIRWE